MLGGSRELGRWDTGSVTLQLGFRGLRGIFGIFLGFKADLKGCCGDFREEFGGLLGIFGGFKGGIFGLILGNIKDIYEGYFVELWDVFFIIFFGLSPTPIKPLWGCCDVNSKTASKMPKIP